MENLELIHDFITCSPSTLSGNPIASLTLKTHSEEIPSPSSTLHLCLHTFVLGSNLLQWEPNLVWHSSHDTHANMGAAQCWSQHGLQLGEPTFRLAQKGMSSSPAFPKHFPSPMLDMLKEVVKERYYWVLLKKLVLAWSGLKTCQSLIKLSTQRRKMYKMQGLKS